MNPVSTSAKAAAGIVASLRGQPLILGLLVVNVIYVSIGAGIWWETNSRRAQIIDKLLTACITNGVAK